MILIWSIKRHNSLEQLAIGFKKEKPLLRVLLSKGSEYWICNKKLDD